MKLFLAEIISI